MRINEAFPKLKPQNNNHDFKEKYPYVRVGTLVFICITKIAVLFCAAVLQYTKKTHNTYVNG